MEYSKGTAGSGSHSHMPVGTKELPCAEIDEEYKATCYASAGSYRQYEPDSESFEKSYEFCFSVPEEYIDSCLLGVHERTFIATGENTEKLDKICERLGGEEKVLVCRKTMREAKNIISL